MTTFILTVIILGIVVVSHEFGHFLLAKMNGIRVVEFAIGMGPILFSFQKGETRYALKLLPIGGSCMFEGEDGLLMSEGQSSGEDEGAFPNASVWSRISTVAAGPFFNFILAFLIALVMVNLIVIREPVVTEVIENGAAAEAGLAVGDRILSLNGEKVCLYEDILLFTGLYSGGDVKISYERGGERREVTCALKYNEAEGRYMLGIANSGSVELKGLDGLKYAWYEMRYSMRMTYKSLGMLFRGKVSRQDVAGPVGIAVNMVGKTYENAREYGWQNVLVNMLNITLMLSVNLGILNLLPVPALDGGRLVFLFLEALRGKAIPPEKEGMVHFAGLVFFMGLMVLLLFNDLSNIFG